jgi:hypothetical protein
MRLTFTAEMGLATEDSPLQLSASEDVASSSNQNGVVIEMKSTTQGASLKLAAEGVKLTIGE